MNDVRRGELVWRKAHCADGACAEAAKDGPDSVLLRSTLRPGAVLSFTNDEWSAFLASVRDGDYD